jgi:peptidoglycan/xylan/chitin deacetylase (PgdA/CDA1 family)
VSATALDLVQFAHRLAPGDLPPGAVANTLMMAVTTTSSASAILTEFEVPATFFVPTERLDERREYW